MAGAAGAAGAFLAERSGVASGALTKCGSNLGWALLPRAGAFCSRRGFNDGDVVTAQSLIDAGIIKKTLDGVKIMGNGELTKKLTVQASKFTASAKEKIEALGGKAEVI